MAELAHAPLIAERIDRSGRFPAKIADRLPRQFGAAVGAADPERASISQQTPHSRGGGWAKADKKIIQPRIAHGPKPLVIAGEHPPSASVANHVQIGRQKGIEPRLVGVIVRIHPHVAGKTLCAKPPVNDQELLPHRAFGDGTVHIFFAPVAVAVAAVIVADHYDAVNFVCFEKLLEECFQISIVKRMGKARRTVVHGLGMSLGVRGGHTAYGKPQPHLDPAIMEKAKKSQGVLAVGVDLTQRRAAYLVVGARGGGLQLGHVTIGDRHLPVAPHPQVRHNVHPRGEHPLRHLLPLLLGAVREINFIRAATESARSELDGRVACH